MPTPSSHPERHSAYADLDGGGSGPSQSSSISQPAPPEGIESVVVADPIKVDVAESDGDVRLADLRIHEPGHVLHTEYLRIRIQMDVLAETRHGRQDREAP